MKTRFFPWPDRYSVLLRPDERMDGRMKQPLAWHKECLSHWKQSFSRLQKEIADLERKRDDQRTEISFYETQIKEAEKLKMDGF